jgi:hypothetical protein
MATTPNPFQAWDDYSDMAQKWRGQIINHAIDLEQVMELFIARHYVLGKTEQVYEQRIEDFKRMFFWETNMGFGSKIQIVKNLIILYQPDFLRLYIIQDVIKELDDVIKCRNAMAHWQLDFSKEYRWHGAENKNIKVNKLKPGTANIYSEDEIKRIIELCRKYTTALLYWNRYPFEEVFPT